MLKILHLYTKNQINFFCFLLQTDSDQLWEIVDATNEDENEQVVFVFVNRYHHLTLHQRIFLLK